MEVSGNALRCCVGLVRAGRVILGVGPEGWRARRNAGGSGSRGWRGDRPARAHALLRRHPAWWPAGVGAGVLPAPEGRALGLVFA